jgi:hypothetical protein
MEFQLDKEKAIEALVYIASNLPGVGRFHAAKILYFAERYHLRAYGRPVIGDRYVAMDNGPVPSFSYNVLKGSLAPAELAMAEGALVPFDGHKHPAYEAGRQPRLEYFSRTDLKCLDEAIAYCKVRSFGAISDETHEHKAWKDAALNCFMKWDDFLDGADKETVDEARAFSAYGVV